MHDPVSPILAEPIVIRLGGLPHTIAAGATLAGLVAAQGCTPEAVASAVNGDFVPRDQRAARELQAGDVVLLFQPITGG